MHHRSLNRPSRALGSLLALALSLLAAPLYAEQPGESCPRPGHRQAPDESNPIGSMQKDELLADSLTDPDGNPCRTSHTPLISELTRHVSRFGDDIWWNDGSGLSLGVIHRDRWRQFFRDHFKLYDEHGIKRAEGTQPIASPGLLFSTMSELYVTGAQQELLVYMYGTFFTLGKVLFHLQDSKGLPIADAHVDMKKSSVVFTMPHAPRMRIGSLLREQVTDDGLDRWRMIVLREDILPDDAWPILGAFFARYQDPSGLTAFGKTLRDGPGRF